MYVPRYGRGGSEPNGTVGGPGGAVVVGGALPAALGFINPRCILYSD
jgi:hypothetical protein